MFFDSISLKKKLVLLSGLAMAALVLAILTGSLGIRSGVHGVEEIGGQRLPAVMALHTIKEGLIALKSSSFETGMWENDTDAQDQFKSIVQDKRHQWTRIESAWKTYETIHKSAEEDALWKRFVHEWEALKKIDLQIIALIDRLAGNQGAEQQKKLFAQYFQLGGQQMRFYREAEKKLGEVLDLNARLVAEETESANKSTRFAQNLMLAVGLVSFFMTAILGFLVGSSILRQMGGDPGFAVEIIRRIASGDLQGEIPLSPGDEKSILASIAFMRGQLRHLIGNVLSSADEVSKTAKSLTADLIEIATSGDEGNRAAASTSTAVERIGHEVAQIGESAQTALRLSEQSGQLSRQGHAVVGSAAAEMTWMPCCPRNCVCSWKPPGRSTGIFLRCARS